MSSTTAPTLDELRAIASGNCTSETLAQLIGYMKRDENGNDDVIIVNRRPDRRAADERKDEYAQQYHRNCFYQFRNLCDTKGSFFGIKDDEERTPAAPEVRK